MVVKKFAQTQTEAPTQNYESLDDRMAVDRIPDVRTSASGIADDAALEFGPLLKELNAKKMQAVDLINQGQVEEAKALLAEVRATFEETMKRLPPEDNRIQWVYKINYEGLEDLEERAERAQKGEETWKEIIDKTPPDQWPDLFRGWVQEYGEAEVNQAVRQDDGRMTFDLRAKMPSMNHLDWFNEQDFYNFYTLSLALPYISKNLTPGWQRGAGRVVVGFLQDMAQNIVGMAKVACTTELRHYVAAVYPEAATPVNQLIKNIERLQETFGSVDQFLKATSSNDVSWDQMIELFGDPWSQPYGGVAYKTIAEEGKKLEAMLPVTLENLKNVMVQVDHVIDLEHNNDLFLNWFTTFGQDDPDYETDYHSLGSLLSDKAENWDEEFLAEKAPQMYAIYENVQRPSLRYKSMVKGLTKFAQSSWGGGSGTGIYGPSQGEGLGIGIPGGGGGGLPHSTNIPPSHQGHPGNLAPGTWSGNEIADHALETQPFNKTLGGFTVEELMSEIKALMKIKTPESMDKAMFLQDILRDKMQRLKAARRAFDVQVLVKNAAIVRELKADPFVEALFEEHEVPLEKLNEVELFPDELTHFALHNLVHKLAQVSTVDMTSEIAARVQQEPLGDLNRKEHFIETTAQTAQPIKGKCPESGETRYMSQSDLVQNDYKADCPEGKRKLKDQKSVSITEYKKHKKNKSEKKSCLKGLAKEAQQDPTEEYIAALAKALKAQNWQRAREIYLTLPSEVQKHFAGKIKMQFPAAVSAYVLEGRTVQEPAQVEQAPAPSDEEVARALQERGFTSNAYAAKVAQRLGGTMMHEDKDGKRIYGIWRQEGKKMLFNIHFYMLPKMKAVQLIHYNISPQLARLHDPDLDPQRDDIAALREKYPNPMVVLTQEAAKYGYSVQVPSMETLMRGANLEGFTKQAEGEIKFNDKEQGIINAVREAAEDLDKKVYLVGGAVRDRLLGRENADLDFMVESGAEELVAHLADKYNTEMPVRYDRSKALMIALDGETLEFINAEKLFQPLKGDQSLEGEEEFTVSFDDAYRRDLTINTLMYDLREDKLLDPTGRGLDDLRNKQLNTVIDPFIKYKIHAPDMLRALRFAATLGFELGPNMLEAMRANVERIRPRDKGGDISNRRIRKELRKAIDTPDHWAKLRSLLTEAGLDVVLADDIDDVQQDLIGGIEYHLGEKEAMRIKGFVTKKAAGELGQRLDQLLEEQGLATKKKPGLVERIKQKFKSPSVPVQPETGERRLNYLIQKLDALLAQTDRAQHEETVRNFLGQYRQLTPGEKVSVMTSLRNYSPSVGPQKQSKEVRWID